jgi:hypothetical protein
MKRTYLNALVDALAFLGFLLLLTTGLLLAYQLPPGSGGLHGVGTGRGASERSIQLVWGLSRHEWGEIHYWIALAMATVLAVHVVLHWKWIACVVRGKASEASGRRLALGGVGLAFAILLSAAPLASPTHRMTREELGQAAAPTVRGSMTIREIAAVSGTTPAAIIEVLGLPADAPLDEGAGRLLRRHSLTMGELRAALERLESPRHGAD